jgi:hypothetical protein
MTAVVDTIDLVNPGDTSTGVPLNNSIQITFDREIDERSIQHGGLVIEGPDTDLVIYPGYTPTVLKAGAEQDILLSAGYQGLVPGEFSFSRIDMLTNTQVDTDDLDGEGDLYRTRVIFKPSVFLRPLTEYVVYLIGDDDAEEIEELGIRTRSVFDTIDTGNVGESSVTFSGTYTGGLTQDKINIRITKSGVVGIAEFEAWRDSQPLNLEGPFLTSINSFQVLDGVNVSFQEGDFLVNDVYSTVVKKPERLTGVVSFKFTTGNGSISAVPTSTSTSITGSPSLTLPSTVFSVKSSTPQDASSNLNPSTTRRITIQFTDDIDPATITEDTVQVHIEPVSDHPLLTNQVQAGFISHTITVSGTKLFIDL